MSPGNVDYARGNLWPGAASGRFDTLEEAISMANDSDYGLTYHSIPKI